MTTTHFFTPTNLIGKVLGSKGLKFDTDTLEIHVSNALSTVHNISNTIEFVDLKTKWYGSQLTITCADKPYTFNFLKQTQAQRLVNELNTHIIANLQLYIESAVNKWEYQVFTRYPRQSQFEELSHICEIFNKGVNQKKHPWSDYINSEKMTTINAISQCYPLQYQTLQQQHETIQLQERADFFDRVESNPLTLDQRKGVLRSDDLNMVLAAAGTGKTSVMVAKALDLIDRGLAEPDEILILAYNKAAANELKERLQDKASRSDISLHKTPHISTFHSLGRQILKEAGISTYMSIFVEDPLKLQQWITEWLHQYITQDISRLVDFISLTPEPVDPFSINTQAEYEAYLRDNELRTLNGELVKGYQELIIANFLYLNGVPYTYEARYVSKRRIEVGFDYTPDFHLDETDIYIEHFGIDRAGKTRPDIDAIQYNEEMESKRALHIECGTTLVESFHYEWVEETLTSGLEKQLKELNIEFNPINSEALFEQLKESGKIANWSELLLKALASIRVERLDAEGMFERFTKLGIAQPQKYTSLLDALHVSYVQQLQEQDAIDFDDMIIRSIESINTGLFAPKWSYVLVDEFQDISTSRIDLVKSIVKHGPTPSLTVVGDDWQSIYRFSGGKLELTTRFGELVGPFTETKLQKTFRYNNSIADTAGMFIMENPEQNKKYIETHTQTETPQVYLLDDKLNTKDGLYQRVVEVITKIKAKDQEGSIAVIGRYNYLLNESKSAVSQANLNDNVAFWSFHKSKGLEADYCILIGFSQGKLGFPNDNKDQIVIEALLPMLDEFPHSEERRLFYVGLTRAKKKLYIIGDPSSPSSFIIELLAPKYNINIHSKAFQETYRKIFKCTNCEAGYLKLVNGKFGSFYACSTGKGCKVGKARVCSACGAPSIDKLHASECNNQACNHAMKICEKCGRPMKLRSGKYGEFWGCTGYGIKDDQCKHTAKQ
ncbi:UvrD-helicase domain-containing protein [Psychromonas sp. 14N.309.X.WAT.B.A12]|uniref:UvrD-helicase domain-containing protein n=1 Tax=Psychromonas sp. 14N.309.X.WAT.B.A12 TaxID=2998322 RepID=UPI0025B27D1A|nr:UvrD-helicase domain-containing protein [Psychromonas sp. 14N.309.X.WAT.B.A12]MDN2662643.1 UvrD-helicase domain-containing protein [Psychromonas sp. 14N.309.X.WAT.B.A12]